MAKDKKINSTTETPAGTVMQSTIAGMDEWDMNKMNDVAGDHPNFNGPSKLGGGK